MLGVSNISWRAGLPLLFVLVAGALVAVWIEQRQRRPTSPALSLDDWDIPQLVNYLNGKGLELRAVPTRENGVLHFNAFLTTTNKSWEPLNLLPNDETQAKLWEGTLYCVRGPGGEGWSDITQQWGDGSLVVGPFLFYGDRELLSRVRDVLMASNP